MYKCNLLVWEFLLPFFFHDNPYAENNVLIFQWLADVIAIATKCITITTLVT